MTTDGRTKSSPGVDRPITRTDLEEKFEQLRGGARPRSDSVRRLGLGAAVGAALLAILIAYVLGRRRGRKRRTVVEIKRV